jgi:hypothetical protein
MKVLRLGEYPAEEGSVSHNVAHAVVLDHVVAVRTCWRGNVGRIEVVIDALFGGEVTIRTYPVGFAQDSAHDPARFRAWEADQNARADAFVEWLLGKVEAA